MSQAGIVELQCGLLDSHLLPTIEVKGEQLYRLEFEFQMTCDGTNIIFDVYYRRIKLGSTRISVDFSNEGKTEGRYLQASNDDS